MTNQNPAPSAVYPSGDERVQDVSPAASVVKERGNEPQAPASTYLSSALNSQPFTTCCRVAIARRESRCPACRGVVEGYSSPEEVYRARMALARALNPGMS